MISVFKPWHRIVLILALGTLLLSTPSCKKDKDDDPQPTNNNNPNPNPQDTSKTWRTAKLTRLELLSFPANKPDGGNWDNSFTGNPPPDVFAIINIDGKEVFDGIDSRKENLQGSASWTLSSMPVTDLDARIQVVLKDYDSLSGHDDMTSFTFSPRNYLPAGTSTSNTYTYKSGGYEVKLYMTFAK